MKIPIETDVLEPKILWLTVALGLCLPLLSNFGPIRSAVGTSLRDSLDLTRKKSFDSFTLSVTHLSSLGLSPLQALLGLFFTLGGFAVYYLVPLSMFYHLPTLFFFIFMCILFAMIVGLLMLSTLSLPFLEKMFIKCCPRSNLKPIIETNLKSHRNRNHKTSLMLMIAVCFLVFCGSAFS
jgi:hypothetical protein